MRIRKMSFSSLSSSIDFRSTFDDEDEFLQLRPFTRDPSVPSPIRYNLSSWLIHLTEIVG